MNTLFLGIVIFLIVLAVFDLVVGVSNDAVNFLNSAIGAKVARYRTVVTVAADYSLAPFRPDSECGKKHMVFPYRQFPLSDVLLSEAHG